MLLLSAFLDVLVEMSQSVQSDRDGVRAQGSTELGVCGEGNRVLRWDSLRKEAWSDVTVCMYKY